MMRWLALLLILISSVADAKLLSGAGTTGACPYVNGSTVGDCITDATSNRLNDSLGQWYFPTLGTPTILDTNTTGTYPANKGILCNPGVYYGSIAFLSTLQAGSTGYYPWYSILGSEITAQEPSPCVVPTTYFLNNTTTGKCVAGQSFCYNILSLTQNASSGDSLEVKAAPSPIPFWYDNASTTGFSASAVINTSNITLTFDSGAAIEYTSDPSGKGAVLVNGTGATVNGGTFAHIPSNNNAACVRVSNGASNFLGENIVNCQFSDTCILGGDATVGTFQLINVTAGDCGLGDPGQDHVIYVGANTNGTDQGPGTFTNDVFHDVLGGGWNFKSRLGSGTVSDSYIVQLGHANDEQNGAIDLPCGGNYAINNSVVEIRALGATSGNWYVAKAGEELSVNGGTDAGCVFTAQVAGTETAGTSTFTGIATNPVLAGIVAGQKVTDNQGLCFTLVCGATVVSTSGSGPYTITITCPGTPSACITANNASHTLLFNAQYATAVGNISGSGATSITGLTVDPRGYMALGEALTGPGLPSGLTISAMTATSISFTGGTATSAETGQTYDATYVNSFTFNHDTVLLDGVPNGATVLDFLCMGSHDASGNCNTTNFGATATVSNTIFVLDSANGASCGSSFGGGGNFVLGAGVTDGGGNTCYNSRSAAQTALGWTGNDQFGNPAPNFPYVPTHL